MAGGLGGAAATGTVTTGAPGRALLIGVSITTGADSAEKIFLPVPA